jgi:Methylamine utilisation protein MauE
MKKSLVVDLISCLLIMLFVYAAISKLNEFQKFQAELGQSPILTAFAKYLVWIVPTIEIIIALMLSINRFRLYGLYASFSMMVMFTTYIIEILNFSFFVPCSCGGILQRMTWKTHLIFNIAFTILALIGIILDQRQHQLIDADGHLHSMAARQTIPG